MIKNKITLRLVNSKFFKTNSSLFLYSRLIVSMKKLDMSFKKTTLGVCVLAATLSSMTFADNTVQGNGAKVDGSDKETIYKQFLYLCNRGDLQAIEDFLYSHIFKNSGEAWVYIYLAQLLGKDFTKDDLRAYNAYTGEAYDDYGPIAIAGREAIQYAMHLDNLSEEKDQLAQKIAQELFEKI